MFPAATASRALRSFAETSTICALPSEAMWVRRFIIPLLFIHRYAHVVDGSEMTTELLGSHFGFRASSFLRHSSFELRHSRPLPSRLAFSSNRISAIRISMTPLLQ